MKKCTYCGKEQPDDATVCPIDGQPLKTVIMPTSITDEQYRNPTQPVAEQQIKGWFLSPTIWFLLALGATFFAF